MDEYAAVSVMNRVFLEDPLLCDYYELSFREDIVIKQMIYNIFHFLTPFLGASVHSLCNYESMILSPLLGDLWFWLTSRNVEMRMVKSLTFRCQNYGYSHGGKSQIRVYPTDDYKRCNEKYRNNCTSLGIEVNYKNFVFLSLFTSFIITRSHL